MLKNLRGKGIELDGNNKRMRLIRGVLKPIIKEKSNMLLELVAPGFKNKTRYTPYVSPGSQISHIAINKGNIIRQCLI